MSPAVRPAELQEFLPAVLEITETPPSPAARAVSWTLMGLLLAAVTWACVAEIAIVAVAPGVVLSPGRTRPVQAAEGGQVKAIHAEDGRPVAEGEVLLQLDSSLAAADVRAGARQLAVARDILALAEERLATGATLLGSGYLARTDFLTLRERHAAAARDVAIASETLGKARRRLDWHSVRAPVAGTVQQLGVRSAGDVVEAGATLMVIVPDGDGYDIEARLENRDRGFVRAGQRATVKADAFPFTRFGTLAGTVTAVSADIAAGDKAAAYLARVRLDDVRLGEQRLVPGMTVSVDIDTGSRRVVDFFLSPLARRASESLKER